MDPYSYNTEVGAHVSSIRLDDSFVEVSLEIRGNRKVCRSTDLFIIKHIEDMGIFVGERVRLLYTSNEHWNLSKYQ